MKYNPTIIKSKFKDLLNQLPFLPQAVSLVWNTARPWTLAWLVLLLLQGLLPIVLLLSTLPGLFVVIRYTLRFHRWRVANTANERRTRYYDWIITWHEAAAELRLFDLGEYFRTAFQGN